MTRFARGPQGTHRKPQEATPWKDMMSRSQQKINRPGSGESSERRVSSKSKNLKKTSVPESEGADYRRKGKKKVPQWKKTEWQMLETGEEETRGIAAALLKKDLDDQNPTKYRPKKKTENPTKTLEDRLKAIQGTVGEFTNNEVQEVTKLLKQDDRRERRRLKRVEERNESKTCFLCRKSGHEITDCPKAKNDMEQGSGICFKCGSLEHSMHSCPVRLPPGEFPYAKCFICGENGHLSKQCPDNPRGLYPNGGCCRTCGSVEHYNKDCPDKQKKQGIAGLKITLTNIHDSGDLEESLIEKTIPIVKKKPKVVKF